MIRFTRHARNRIRLWRVTEAEVTDALDRVILERLPLTPTEEGSA